ncbi:MAG: peptidoglycan DD-metalloendopeptidase family protein [Candidatus Promineifilaceae bacterium]
MKRSIQIVLIASILVLLVPVTWLAWENRPIRSSGEGEAAAAVPTIASHSQSKTVEVEAVVAETAVLPLPPDTYTPVPTAGPPATPTAVPTSTPRPTETPTTLPTMTLTPSPPPSLTPDVIADGIDRTCPDPAPLKPDYNHYFLPAQSWPSPIGEEDQHFWLSHPFAGGSRLLYTDWFPYGYDVNGRYLLHNGVDISEPLGTPVLAMAAGTVVVASDDYSRLYGWRCDWYGHLVVIELDQKWLDQPVYIVYGHVLNLTVSAGQQVNPGDQVAEVGVGGAATVAHLHIEVRVGTNDFGSTRNPLLWVNPPTSRGLVAGRVVDPEGRPWQGVAVNAIGQGDGSESYTTWTYLGDPQNLINPDEVLAENFVIGDMAPGKYLIVVLLQGVEYHAEVEVRGGELSTVEIVTEPFKPATPEPESTPGS